MFAPDLFPSPDNPCPDVLCDAQFLSSEEHDVLFQWCAENVTWRQMSINFRGKEVPIPRRLGWYGDVPYAYSGLNHPASPMPAPLRAVADRIETWLQAQGQASQFNSCLLNHYRDGNDSIGMHADDESQLEPEPVIASLSLGATRTFIFQHMSMPRRLEEPLPGGSLLVMRGATQKLWRHGIPKEPGAGMRINLTFRNTLKPPEK